MFLRTYAGKNFALEYKLFQWLCLRSIFDYRLQQIIEIMVLCRTWFHHEDPWAISLTGVELKSAFVKPGNITTNIFDAIIRLLQEEDTTMYKLCRCDQQQWRHLLPKFLCECTRTTITASLMYLTISLEKLTCAILNLSRIL